MIDFSIPPELASLGDQVRRFVSSRIVPYENDPRLGQHGPDESLRRELIELARSEGLLTPQAPREFGGRGLSHIEQAVVYEAAGWSTLGPIAMNCAAPDEGNMMLLARLANDRQRHEYLEPLIRGECRSAFAVSEPNGAGSDPSQLTTTAVVEGDDFVIDGVKWLITGANGARVWLIMANVMSPEEGGGPTLFLATNETPGLTVERTMASMDRNYVGGHSVVRLQSCRIPAIDVLGEVGGALRYAQMRLAPARLTHAMRWAGAASRAHAIALEYAQGRAAFGRRLIEHEGVSFMLAENEIALAQCRLSILYTAWLLDQGQHARHESSVTKAFVAEELFRVVDRCVQILGGLGVTDDSPVAMIFRDIRAFRIYDGPTEVHKYAIARRIDRSGPSRPSLAELGSV